MSNVTLTIGGRDYTVACAAGEETHVVGLGRLIDGMLDTLPGAVAHSETRSLLFAALLLADELHERRAAMEAEANRAARVAAANAISPDRLAALATRLETLAELVERVR